MKTPATIFAAGTAFTPSVWPAKAAEVMPPKEADAAIMAELKAGANVPGVTPFRAVPGKFFGATKAHLKLGGKELTLPVKQGAKGATFKLKLKPGRDELWAKFTAAKGTPMGAFYAYVTKLEQSSYQVVPSGLRT